MRKRKKSRRIRIRFNANELTTMSSGSREQLLGGSQEALKSSELDLYNLVERPLTKEEKNFLLNVDRGDYATVEKLIQEHAGNPEVLDINCVDPLNRSALIAAIENENFELIKLLLNSGIKVKDALLHAIKEEYVEAVEVLLQWEEENHKPGEPYSWESVEAAAATFTSDITPLILAAHRNHYEILKILLDRGATLPIPHDVKCGCDECVKSSTEDSLRHSQARINAYRALSSPSLIALSSTDPVLTAFQLSWELGNLSVLETEFRSEYRALRQQVQEFSTSLLDHTRTSNELEIMLNYNPGDNNAWNPGERQTLERLKLAINYKQKMFVAHANVQQLLGTIWYEGLPGFRRKSIVGQCVQVAKLGVMFPVYCTLYMLSPESENGKFMKKPFVKFICHSTSYMFFLMLLSLASQRAEFLVLEYSGISWLQELVEYWKKHERGSLPGLIESTVILYIMSLIWGEVRSLWSGGLMEYISDLWNIVDFITNVFYIGWIFLRFTSWYIVQRDYKNGLNPWYPRERWDAFDPMLLSEGAFAAGMIFSFLKLVHIFSINPYLGPLQVSLGRMIIDILKFFFVYMLVLFAFACGLNQLMWYYAELESQKCYHLPSGVADFDSQERACTIWRRFSNMFETSQSLFWASFGLVDLTCFELTGMKSFTRFWALLTFGSYSVINIIVLLNMLIAMMSNSYQIISERSDMEWKFARSTLWLSYFEDGDTVPPPFNIVPTPKNMKSLMTKIQNKQDRGSIIKKSREKARIRHETIMRVLVRRYVTAEQRDRDEEAVTEDDVMEIRQDISTLRFELIDILQTNGMKTPRINLQDATVAGKKGKQLERQILKDFQIGIVENLLKDVITKDSKPKDVFTQLAKAMQRKGTAEGSKKKDWNAMVRKNTSRRDPIGSTSERRNRQSLRRHIIDNVESKTIDTEKLLAYNPKLTDVTPTTRVAYVKFMKKKLATDIKEYQENSDYKVEDEVFEAKEGKRKSTKKRAPAFRARTPIPEISDDEASKPNEIKVEAEIEGKGSTAEGPNKQLLRQQIFDSIEAKTIDPEKLIEYNPKLTDVSPKTRVAYAMFMKKKLARDIKNYRAPARIPIPEISDEASKPNEIKVEAEIERKGKPGTSTEDKKDTTDTQPSATSGDKTVVVQVEKESPTKNLYITKEEDEKLQKPLEPTPTPSGPELVLSAATLEADHKKEEGETQGSASGDPKPSDGTEGSDSKDKQEESDSKPTETKEGEQTQSDSKPEESTSEQKDASKGEQSKEKKEKKKEPPKKDQKPKPAGPVPTTVGGRGKSKATGKMISGWI